MSHNLSPKTLPQLLTESFAFVSINLKQLTLLFILPAILVFLSSILLKTGFFFLKGKGRHKPFTLFIRQNKDQSLHFKKRQNPETVARAKGIRRIEGLKAHSTIQLVAQYSRTVPQQPGRLYLINKDKLSRIKTENRAEILKTIQVPEARKKTTLLVITHPGWELRINGKNPVLDRTGRKQVRILRTDKGKAIQLNLLHHIEIRTGNRSGGWIDGLHFTYGSPAIETAGWVTALFQIGSIIAVFFLTAVLVCMVFTGLFNDNRTTIRGVALTFRASAARIIATLIFLTVIQLPVPGLLQWKPLLAGGEFVVFFLIPALLFLVARISPTVFISQMQSLSPWQALLASFRLTRGSSLRFFLVVSALFLALILYLNLAGFITAEILGFSRAEITSAMTSIINSRVYIWPEAVLLFFGSLLLLTVPLIPVITHLLYSLYIDTRIRKEGLQGAPLETLLNKRR